MSSDYGYINARIRAMRSFLLKEEDYLNALRQRTESEFLAFLGSLPSYADFAREGIEYGEVLKLNMCRIFRKIINFCEDAPRRLIEIILSHWDIYNLKTIRRGIKGLIPRDGIVHALIPAGKWDMGFLNSLIDTDTEKELAGYEAYFKDSGEALNKDDNNERIVRDYLQIRTEKNRLFSYCFNLYTSGNPLSIAIPLGFINFKENEINNLRLIGTAIRFGMPMELVKEELIYAR